MTRTLLLCLFIVALGTTAIAVLFATEPEAKREGATKETAMLVETVEVRRGTYRPVIVATGVVEASREIVASPRVEGQIVEVAPGFVPGGFVQEGEVLVRIDPSDYANALEQRRSELAQAEAGLDVEMGRQNVARQDYELLQTDLDEASESLVLRKPQLATARARVASARAAVRQAELEWERTAVRAPFDAHVLERGTNVGSHVHQGDALGRLIGIDTYWVTAAVPVHKLAWMSFPENGESGSPVEIRHRTAWPEGSMREGEVHRLIGALEGQTRLARVLITIDDPLARAADAGDRPVLMLGSFVEVSIQADPVEDVVRLSRDHLRTNDTVWVMDDESMLRVRPVDIVVRDAEAVYLRSGLEDGDRVVTTNLSTVVDGAPLRTEGEGGSS